MVGTAFVVYFSKDAVALDTFDFWVGSVCIYVLATIQVILFGWVMGVERGFEELKRGAEIRIPKLVMYIIKYVSPAYLLTVFVVWLFQTAGTYVRKIGSDPVVAGSVGFIVLVFVFFLLITAQSVRRWNKLHPLDKEVGQ